jgi:hypothetical protein
MGQERVKLRWRAKKEPNYHGSRFTQKRDPGVVQGRGGTSSSETDRAELCCSECRHEPLVRPRGISVGKRKSLQVVQRFMIVSESCVAEVGFQMATVRMSLRGS